MQQPYQASDKGDCAYALDLTEPSHGNDYTIPLKPLPCWATGLPHLLLGPMTCQSRMVAAVRCGVTLQRGSHEQPGGPGSAPGARSARDQEQNANPGNQGACSCPSGP